MGCAGSAKTWLALEQTRRLAKTGQSVAFVGCSRGPPTLLALKDRDAGGVYVFLDEGKRVLCRLGAAPIELPLDRNIRNTKRIAQVFGSLGSPRARLGALTCARQGW